MGLKTRRIPEWLRGLLPNLFASDRPEPDSDDEDGDVQILEPVARSRRVRRHMRRWRDREERRRRRSKRKRDEALRREINATYRQLAGGNATVARALRITQGKLPDEWGALCRLTRWGKNHHVDASGDRTFCGLDATNALPVHWGRGWCVQCDDVAKAMEQTNAIESRKETGT